MRMLCAPALMIRIVATALLVGLISGFVLGVQLNPVFGEPVSAGYTPVAPTVYEQADGR
ncbi:hypothetical protein [Amycolatopsis albispora]|uniref:hypothetical protein n=1 Tax=Amycolatopsis albispora TaxID=1804986 RepID=UPI0013B43F32|nr:hypothetical protein [Amycolatopsis albispora]